MSVSVSVFVSKAGVVSGVVSAAAEVAAAAAWGGGAEVVVRSAWEASGEVMVAAASAGAAEMWMREKRCFAFVRTMSRIVSSVGRGERERMVRFVSCARVRGRISRAWSVYWGLAKCRLGHRGCWSSAAPRGAWP